MKTTFAKYIEALIIVAIVFMPFQSFKAQNFERIETISSLNALRENNGVAVSDYDQDGDLDIFVVAKAKDDQNNPITLSKLYRNNNDGSFTDVTEASGLINLYSELEDPGTFFGLDGYKFGAFWGDYNNDGFPDIFFTHLDKVQLFRNQGNGLFVEVTVPAGIRGFNGCGNTNALWFDYNNDGFLDLFISDWRRCDNNTLYRNNGNETFTNVTESAGISSYPNHYSYTALPFDFNDDGFMDIFLMNDFSAPNQLFINQNGISFTEEAMNYGVNQAVDAMGLTIGDFNNNGSFDFYISAIDENVLLQNNGSNNFSDVAQSFGVRETGWSWGTKFVDFDLDGDEDLIVVNGFEFGSFGFGDENNAENNFYFENNLSQGSVGFTDVSVSSGFNAETISVEALAFDYDNDGDLDVYISNADRPSFFYENKLINFNEEHSFNWLKINLEGTISNRDAIGTKIKLSTAEGNLIRYYSGVGFLGQSLQPVHFGLDQSSGILSIEITWPSGLVETHQNLNSNTTIKATEGQGFVVLDIQPSQKIFGCTDPNSCNYNPNATLNDGNCSYLDSNQIIGSVSAGYYSLQTYSYAMASDSEALWEVAGGEIIEGQGTSVITVLWEIESEGTVRVQELNQQCNGLPVQLNVELSIDELPENISIARLWNEALLASIRGDFARPNVHARNLFHSSVVMYDIWAVYDERANPYLLGNVVNNFSSNLEEFLLIESVEESRQKAISYAMYRLLSHRFRNSPGAEKSQARYDLIMSQLDYDINYTSTNYQFGNAAAFGNYVAQVMISYGNNDNSRESSDYNSAFYQPVNPPIILNEYDNGDVIDINRWQPLTFNTFIDQSGNLITGSTPPFLGPEWGSVHTFALNQDDKTTFQRDGNTYAVYLDPGEPPKLNLNTNDQSSENFKWNFSLVSVWSAHLDPADNVIIDISPNSIGNVDISQFPSNFNDFDTFYNFIEGGDISDGYNINPKTNQPYQTQLVPRADYTRVLAEFWADGPDSETPPGHWFTILNYVSDQPELEKRFSGTGDILGNLEWDVKSYFILGGAVHDAAIAAWGAKGWYDYVRPISAIRYMAALGQSTDASLPNYHVAGLPLVPGYIETVEIGDPLAGFNNENVGKIKVYAWRGHDFVSNSETDIAGVGWILGERWWPYQRPSFVTPPFAGYVSGHSTFSRAAAEVLTLITGDEYFPGGMGEFVAKKDEFLVFEKGPSVDIKLQWATYRDASDQTSLSRIWGGIHPPADDIPGRVMGNIVGNRAFNFAVPYFNSEILNADDQEIKMYPNPVTQNLVNITNTNFDDIFEIYDINGRAIRIQNVIYNEFTRTSQITLPESVVTGLYILKAKGQSKVIIVKN